MLIEEFVKRRKLLEELRLVSHFPDDVKILVVVQDKRMPLAAYIKCPSLPVLWSAIRRISGGEFDEDNVKLYYKEKPEGRMVFPLRRGN